MTEFTKYDGSKPRMELLPWEALTEIAKVLTFGAQKYDDDNWRNVDKRQRYAGALFRHMAAYQQGHTIDQESGLHHLAHAGCCLLFLLTADLLNLGKDTRPCVGQHTKPE